MALSSRLAGAIVLDAAEAAERPASDSPASRTPQREWAESDAAAAHAWNPRGTGLTSRRLPFPVLLAAPGDGAAALRSAAAHNARNGFGSLRLYHARLDHAMTARGDAATCLQAATCLPLGGYSAFAALPAAPPSSAPPPRLLLVTAALDAAAFFHERAVGADAALSGLVVMLAAADALSRLPPLPAPPARRLAFAALAGEPWGYLGTRMLAAQLAGGAHPAGVSAEDADVLELGALGCDAEPGAPVQLYTHAAGAAGAPMAAALAAAASGSGAGLRVSPATASASDTGQGLPPSGLRALRRRHAAWGGVVLSDYDASYGNANAGSRFDDQRPVPAALAAAADVIAAALHALAAGGAARSPQPPAGGRAATLRRVEALMVRACCVRKRCASPALIRAPMCRAAQACLLPVRRSDVAEGGPPVFDPGLACPLAKDVGAPIPGARAPNAAAALAAAAPSYYVGALQRVSFGQELAGKVRCKGHCYGCVCFLLSWLPYD